MTLAELIAALAAADSRLLLPRGFHKPHSYRGYYEQVAFEPVGDITVADMLAAARSALGATYEGWKGGDYLMGETTVCNVAFEGTTGSGMLADDEITPESLAALLAAGVLSELPERDASEVMSPAEEAELIDVIETSGPTDFVEVTRPEGVAQLIDVQPSTWAVLVPGTEEDDYRRLVLVDERFNVGIKLDRDQFEAVASMLAAEYRDWTGEEIDA